MNTRSRLPLYNFIQPKSRHTISITFHLCLVKNLEITPLSINLFGYFSLCHHSLVSSDLPHLCLRYLLDHFCCFSCLAGFCVLFLESYIKLYRSYINPCSTLYHMKYELSLTEMRLCTNISWNSKNLDIL